MVSKNNLIKLLVISVVLVNITVISGCVKEKPPTEEVVGEKPAEELLEEKPKEEITPPTTPVPETPSAPAPAPSPKTTAPPVKKGPEPLEIPFEASHFGFMHPEGSLSEAAELKVHWARPHPGPFLWDSIEPEKGRFDFSSPDREVRLLQEYDFTMIATIWPYADWDQESCRKRLSFEKIREFRELGYYRQMPCDMEAYKNFVKTVVERYDGDGIDDMPGLKYPVKYWEVINEPSMKEDLVFFYGSPEEYFEVLKATYEAVKEADPEAKVLNGGIAGFDYESRNFWQKVIDLGGAKYFDIFNHHSISGPEDLHVPEAKSFMRKNNIRKPHWIPEVEFSAWGLKRERLTPEEWANVIVRSYIYSFGEGVDKLFYVGLDESPGDPESWLLYTESEKKPHRAKEGPKKRQATFYAFKTMVEKIDYFTAVRKLGKGKYKFTVKGKPVYVLWAPGPVPTEITGTVLVTNIRGYTRKIDATSITLTESPIFVEPLH